MKTFKFVISTPNGNMYEGEILKVSLRGTEGDLAIMANHTPFITTVKPCEGHIELADGEVKKFDIKEGILSVGKSFVDLTVPNAAWLE